jgi:hypothetical protein
VPQTSDVVAEFLVPAIGLRGTLVLELTIDRFEPEARLGQRHRHDRARLGDVGEHFLGLGRTHPEQIERM